jgi:hypothetical protein
MAMFTVHLDESYGEADAYSVAGYVATVEQWAELEREFGELAEQEDYKVLHKADLEHFRGEFKWPYLTQEQKVERRLRINKRACGIILRRVRAGFGASVIKSEWDAIDKGKWGSIVGKSFYAAGVHMCFAFIRAWADRFKVNEPIRYVFERGAEGRDEVEKLLKGVEKKSERSALYRLGGWSFESKKDEIRKGVPYPGVVPLQAADFLAYEVYRLMDNQVVNGVKLNRNGDPIPDRGALLCLLQNSKYMNCSPLHLPTPHYIKWQRGEDLRQQLAKLESQFPDAPSDWKW